MIAKEKTAVGVPAPATAEGQVVLTDTSSTTSILPQDEAESQRIVTMIAKVLCRLYGEATGQQLEVVSVKRRQDMTTK